MTSFDPDMSFVEFGLNDRLLKALDKHELTHPTEVQQAAIPPAMYGEDLMVGAETGSGKTAAFVLPMLDRLLLKDARNSGTRALILVPTRELAKQVFKQVKQLSSFSHLETGLIVGGEDYKYQKVILRKNPEIIIATPGRLLEHIEKKATDFDDLELLVLDEADRMLDMGFSDDVLNIVSHCDIDRQTLFFSATLKAQKVLRLGEQILSNPKTLVLNERKNQQAQINQLYVVADDDRHKERLVTWLLANETYEKCLVFTNTRESTQALGEHLGQHQDLVAYLHGEMDQKERNAIMGAFRHGKAKILVATDVASRGLDIAGVDLVINFHMARNGDDYVHRIGRTGRAGATGTAISLITANEWNLKASISKYLDVTMEAKTIKGLEGQYKGPKKVKSNGKAFGKKKKKKPVDKATAKPNKNRGKKPPVNRDGFGPLKKKKS